MTTSIYLDSVLKVLPAVQARQITDFLNDLKVSGDVRNADEYQQKLMELATLINSTDPKPSFQQIRALVWSLATAEAHNHMMRALKNDIEASFLQVDEIGEKVDDHHFLIMKNLAADMERGLADQENMIRRLEWLAGQNNEFSVALVNAFASASLLRVARGELGAGSLYFDNRTYQSRTEIELPNAVVSEHAQKLILDNNNEPVVQPVAARLFSDANSYGTEVNTSINNDINNIIDGTRGTFWTRDVYLAEAVPKVTTVIEFDLGLAKDINYMIVEGASETPFFIESVDAIAPDGHKVNLLGVETVVNGWGRVDFDRVLVRAVQVTFATHSYTRAEYFVDKISTIHDVLSPSDAFDEVAMAKALGPLAAEVVASENLTDILNIPTGNSQQINSFLYPFALDNVWFGNSQYADSGIFVSKPLKDNDFGVVAVQANENIDSGTVRNSIEYEIIKRDLTPQYREIRFPIPRLEQTSVVSERLTL
ncbi:MAG: hypothetical protein ACXABY_30035, partial [Candidatus Thorarchaeota archaeon]